MTLTSIHNETDPAIAYFIADDIPGGCAIIKSMDSVVAARNPGDGVGPDVGPSKSAA